MNTIIEGRPNTIRQLGQKGQVTPFLASVNCLGISCSRGKGGGLGGRSSRGVYWVLVKYSFIKDTHKEGV
jgi:hypothetical protein